MQGAFITPELKKVDTNQQSYWIFGYAWNKEKKRSLLKKSTQEFC